MYYYIKTEENLWTVGSGEGQNWTSESDHNSPEEAAERVHFLNGGTPKKCNHGGNAFPYSDEEGMTLREYYAGKIASGLVSTCDSNGEWSWDNSKNVADVSVEVADALIKRLNQ